MDGKNVDGYLNPDNETRRRIAGGLLSIGVKRAQPSFDELIARIPGPTALDAVRYEQEDGHAFEWELGELIKFMNSNAGHLLAGDFVTYELHFYNRKVVDQLLEGLRQRGYVAEYRRVNASSKLLDIISIYLAKEKRE